MIYGRGKISLRQALLLNMVATSSASLRVIPSYSILHAKQAAWLTPLVSFGIFFVFLFVLNGLFKKNKEKSFIEILQKVMGKPLGKSVSIFYFIWLTFYLVYFIRVLGERLVIAFPDIHIVIIILPMLLLVAYTMRSDIVVMARMGEIFFAALLIVYIITNILILPETDFKNFLPLTHKDIYPVLKGSTIITSVWSFLIVVFLFGDRINDKERIKTVGLQALLVQVSVVFTIANPLGVFGWSIANKMPIPYFQAIRQISVFDIFERLELIELTIVILSDFALIALYSFAALHILKLVFQASNTKPLINIYLVLLFCLSLIISKSNFELKQLIPIFILLNIIMGLILPVSVFVVGKIRRKV